MERPTSTKLKDQTNRFPRKVTIGKKKATGRAKVRRRAHAAKID